MGVLGSKVSPSAVEEAAPHPRPILPPGRWVLGPRARDFSAGLSLLQPPEGRGTSARNR